MAARGKGRFRSLGGSPWLRVTYGGLKSTPGAQGAQQNSAQSVTTWHHENRSHLRRVMSLCLGWVLNMTDRTLNEWVGRYGPGQPGRLLAG